MSELYIFLDEGGNFDFSNKGTRYYTLSALTTTTPLLHTSGISELKYQIWNRDLELEYFRAAEDLQTVRDIVFEFIQTNADTISVDTIVIQKNKVNPVLQNDIVRFYGIFIQILLKYVFNFYGGRFNKIIVVTDTPPTGKHGQAKTKALKTELKSWVKGFNSSYNIYHFASKSDANLQIVDYLNWAVEIKWERGERRSYDFIKKCIRSEFDVLANGTTIFY